MKVSPMLGAAMLSIENELQDLIRSRGRKFAFACLLVIAAPLFIPTVSSAQQKNPRVPATVQGYESADLYAKFGGYIKSVSVNIGDTVVEGQELAIIDVPEMQKQLAQKESMLLLAQAKLNQGTAKVEEAKAHLEALQAAVKETEVMRAQKQALYNLESTEFQRISRLAGSGAIQTELVDSAQYKLQAACAEQQAVAAKIATATSNLAGGKAAVRRAEADATASAANVKVAQADIDFVTQLMNYSTIRAPWDGKITERMYDSGAFVQPAEGNSAAKPLLKIVRDDKVRVIFSLSQKDIAGLEKGIKVTLGEIDALPNQTFEGEISRFSAELDPKTRMMRVEVDLDNPTGSLKPGFFGYATVHFDN